MGLVYLPTFTIQINHPWIGKYTVRPMDPYGSYGKRKVVRSFPSSNPRLSDANC